MRIALVVLCAAVASLLAWALLFAALAGTGWAAAGLVFGVTLSVTVGWIVNEVLGEKAENE